MQNRRNVLAGILTMGGITAASASAHDDLQPQAVFNSGLQLFFAQRDAVITFDTNTGIGTHMGTVEGAIAGTSITNFQFIPTSQSTIKFDNRVLITDVDGDQILFSHVGTGRFLLTPLADSTNPLGNLMSPTGGPLVGTYTALQGSGKYAFLVGRKFPCKMLGSNSTRPVGGAIGNVYGEIYSDNVGVITSAIKAYPRPID